jgi:hypothetical protein
MRLTGPGLRAVPVALLVVALLVVAQVAPAGAELRITNLDVFLNDFEVTVNLVLLGAIPPTFREGVQGGIPTHVRFTVELWQYNWLLPDRLVTSKVVERQLVHNPVSKDYKVVSIKGETRVPYVTRELWEAQRVLSEVRTLKLTAARTLDAADVFYLRVHAETALQGENSFVARMNGTAEQTSIRSEYRTVGRIH